MKLPISLLKMTCFFFLTGDKKDLACPVLIDMKQLTQEELEQVQYYIGLYLYDLIYS